MDKIEDYRQAIDAIDTQIMQLFEQRMEQVKRVAEYKREQKLPIFQKAREQEVINRNTNKVVQKELVPYATVFLQHLMDVSKKYQQDHIGCNDLALSSSSMVVGFQGVAGSFSEQALCQYFGEAYTRKAFKSFEEVFEALKYNYIQYGVLPIENSTTGSITQIYDLLKNYGYAIVGEVNLKIEQHLLALEGANLSSITRVYSHPQGLAQCSEYLKTLGACEQVAYHNTAMSAQHVKNCGDPTQAAIGSQYAAELYGLNILMQNIANAKENITRFVIVGKQVENSSLADKLTIVFKLSNQPGCLNKILGQFAAVGINLSKIESRPVGDGSFSYFFYVDLEGNSEDEKVKCVLEQVRNHTEAFQYLGCYKGASQKEKV